MAVLCMAAGCSQGWQGPHPPVETLPSGQHGVAAFVGPPAQVQWTFKGKAYFAAPPVAVGPFLAVGDRKGQVQFLDPNSGRRRAVIKGKGAIRQPLVWDSERLYLVTDHSGRSLQCFKLEGGKPAWHRRFSQLPGTPIRSGAELWLPVRDTLYALDPGSGEVLRAVVAGGDLWGTPVPTSAGWALLGRSGVLVALADDGRQLWRAELYAHCFEPPAVTGDTIWVSTSVGTLICVTGEGEVLFERNLDSTALFGATVGASGLYVGAASGNVWSLNAADGTVRWQRLLGAPLSGAPLVREDWVAVTLRDGHLELLDAGNGATLATVDYASILPFAPAWNFGRLYVIDSERRLHALGTGP